MWRINVRTCLNTVVLVSKERYFDQRQDRELKNIKEIVQGSAKAADVSRSTVNRQGNNGSCLQ